MSSVNQRGMPVVTETLLPYGPEMTPAELHEALSLLCDHLGVRIIRTNATKSGSTEIELETV